MQKTTKDWLEYYKEKGFSFFNTGSINKTISTPWSKYQKEKPNDSQISVWLNKYATQNYAVVCGEVSNIIVFDVDTKNDGDPTPFLNKGMYEVRTPSGGYHFYCKYDETLGKTLHSKTAKLKGVDIQSNGAPIFLPNCWFKDKNAGYTLVNDVEITPIPDDVMQFVLEALQPETPIEEIKPYKPKPYHFTGEAKPGDIYNALATWAEVLIPLGWMPLGGLKQNGIQYWKRPGKNDGVSASTNWGGYDLLIAFTTSTALEPNKGYTKFGALTQLQYNGDFRECAKDLVLRRINSNLSTKRIMNQ